MNNFLKSAHKEFSYYKGLGDKAMAQVPDELLAYQPDQESNSIGTIVKHLSGNMLSRWTDFLETDGEKEWRQRDTEFENDLNTREKVNETWNQGWAAVFNAIEPLTDEDLSRTVYIRNQPHTVVEAINRQIAHYAYHVGQIVYLSKLFAGEKWQTLSIARNKSTEYNKARFSQREPGSGNK